MCEIPCSNCSENTFYSCSACLDPTATLVGSLCITSLGYWYIQIITCSMLVAFLIPVILRKRAVVLMRILDMIQIISYFKLINGYTAYRHIWLYLGMRSWGSWTEGWNLLAGDELVPIWTNEEGHIDKTIRIACTWAIVVLAFFLIGLIKNALE